MQPRDEKIERKDITKSHQQDGPQIGAAQHGAPRQPVIARERMGADLLNFGLGHVWVFRWGIPIPPMPRYAPEDADCAQHVKRSAPAKARLNRHDQQRRDGSAELRGHPYEPKGPCALDDRKPARNADPYIGKVACLSRASDQRKLLRSQRPDCTRPRHTVRQSCEVLAHYSVPYDHILFSDFVSTSRICGVASHETPNDVARALLRQSYAPH